MAAEIESGSCRTVRTILTMGSEKKCIIEGCLSFVGNKGAHSMCGKHYMRVKRYGDPEKCTSSKTHGMKKTPEWEAWSSIRKRCLNPNHKYYHRYGGRGITICDEWMQSFENFYRDMGPRPPGYSIDRINNNKGYSKENCRWATQKQQLRNTSANRLIQLKGELIPVAEAAERCDIPSYIIYNRLRHGWPSEKIFNTPIRSCKKV